MQEKIYLRPLCLSDINKKKEYNYSKLNNLGVVTEGTYVNDKDILVVEGPLDSLFLDNCIAVAGSDFSKPLSVGGKLITNEQLTIVFDNEPRNLEICKQIKKTIQQGRKEVLWPATVIQKDINDMISGLVKEEIEEIIKMNTFSLAEAQLRFVEWRKINA